MDKYRNTILRYNPRSYLDLEGQTVNVAIRDTILNSMTNEFALFNNGITMLSEETNINEKIGQKNKAQLRIKNPQIINGGQTSVTLSRIYRDNFENAESIFDGKEVLLKIITLIGSESSSSRLHLIDEISNATNKQTPVINADKLANESIHIELQRRVFSRYGLLYERKRGEFSDGVRDGYVERISVVERNHFWRLMYSANGKVNRGFKKKLFQQNQFSDILPASDGSLDRLYLALKVFGRLRRELNPNARIGKDIYGKVYAYTQLFGSEGLTPEEAAIDANLQKLEQHWDEFLKTQSSTPGPWIRSYFDKETGQQKSRFISGKYFKSIRFERDLKTYFLAICS
jgi:hypothetical protein